MSNIVYYDKEGQQVPFPFVIREREPLVRRFKGSYSGRYSRSTGDYWLSFPSVFSTDGRNLLRQELGTRQAVESMPNLYELLTVARVAQAYRRGMCRSAFNDIPSAEVLNDAVQLQAWIDGKLIQWADAVELELVGAPGQIAVPLPPPPNETVTSTDPLVDADDLDPDGDDGGDDEPPADPFFDSDTVDIEGIRLTYTGRATITRTHSGANNVDIDALMDRMMEQPTPRELSEGSMAELISGALVSYHREHEDLDPGRRVESDTGEEDMESEPGISVRNIRALTSQLYPMIRRLGYTRQPNGTYTRNATA